MARLLSKPFDLIIFGGTGDLSLRKLLPSMYRAFCEGELPEGSRILLGTRKPKEHDDIRAVVSTALKKFMATEEINKKSLKDFLSMTSSILLDLVDTDKGWSEFKQQLTEQKSVERIFYLAVAPSLYGSVCENLSQFELITDTSRVVVEKPIGYDFDSAEDINNQIAKNFREAQIFRIDHYLGKETVQNLLALRFSNSLFEQLWDAKYIDNIQISINEQVGLEGRAGFYDDAGAVRDMLQNHLMQLVCLVAMESPNKMNGDNIRAEKIKVLEALQPLIGDQVSENTVRGQYVAGNIDGKLVPGYLEELGQPKSLTETYVAVKASIANWRWSGVPFYLRTGKRLKQRSAEIVIQFKEVSHNVFEDQVGPIKPNQLIIQLQPEEKMQLTLMAKDMTQLQTKLKPVVLDLNFTESDKEFKSFGYKRLLLDVIANNPALFIHRKEGAAAWRWIDPILAYWNTNQISPELYRAGTYGPAEADELLRANGHEWINLN